MQKAYPTSTVPFQAVPDGSKHCRIQLFNPENVKQPGRLRIHVLFTNPGDTRAALNTAIEMACELEFEIALIVTQIVPFPLSLDDPPVPLDFASEQIRRLAESVSTGPTELQGYIFLCRNPIETLVRELPARSLIVIGIRPRWPFGKSKRLARALRRSGHEVILANHE
jgi:hypothetical protein